MVLVGGPTQMSAVRDFVRDLFGKTPHSKMNPDQVVVEGAALHAELLTGHSSNQLLLDVVPLRLGIETYGGLMAGLIPRNTKIPFSVRESFTTFADRQTGVDIHVLQGERERVEDNQSLARFKLTPIAIAPAGVPRIEVTFAVDADGILQVSAQDQHSGARQSIEVRPTSGLTEEKIQALLQRTAQDQREDEQHRKLVRVQQEASSLLKATQKMIQDYDDPRMPQVRELFTALEVAAQNDDVGEIERLCRDLNRVGEPLAEAWLTDRLRQHAGSGEPTPCPPSA